MFNLTFSVQHYPKSMQSGFSTESLELRKAAIHLTDRPNRRRQTNQKSALAEIVRFHLLKRRRRPRPSRPIMAARAAGE